VSATTVNVQHRQDFKRLTMTYLQCSLLFIKTWQCICDHNSGRSWWILIIFTYLETKMNALLLIYFACDVNMTSVSRSRHWWAATASDEWVARLGAVADWWHSWACVLVFVPVVDTLNRPCDCQFLFSVLGELYVSHTRLMQRAVF